MSILYSEKVILVNEIMDWLPTANPQDILGYVEVLDEKDPSVVTEALNILLEECAKQRTEIIQVNWNDSVTKFLTEYELESALALANFYDSKSILASYQKDYQELNTDVVADIRPFAASYQKLWAKVLLFATAKHQLVLSRYIDALCSVTIVSIESAQLLSEKANVLAKQLDETTTNGSALKNSLVELLDDLQIIPETEIVRYKQDLDNPDFLRVFTDILDVLNIMNAAHEGGLKTVNPMVYKALTWKLLASRFEEELFTSNLSEKMAEKRLEKTEEYRTYYSKLLKPVFLENGLALQQIVSENTKMSPEKKELALEAFSYTIYALPLTYVYLLNSEEEEIEDIIAQIMKAKSESTLLQFISERTKNREVSEVPIITNLIKIIAEVF